ncbi:MAG: hypothetical protein RL328_892, partial [Acidobacteriota bacterium]
MLRRSPAPICEVSAARATRDRMEDQEIVREFLLESNENLGRLDQEIVELERHPKNIELLASIFRTIHTIKGTCGFLGFTLLEGIAHEAENILSQMRSGQRAVNEQLISIILESIDAIKSILRQIEATGAEGPDHYQELRSKLGMTARGEDRPAPVLYGRRADDPPGLVVTEGEKG